jgi:hypothetical protein
MQTAYVPTGLSMKLPPQSHQYPHVNRQLPFLATLDLPDLSRILNDRSITLLNGPPYRPNYHPTSLNSMVNQERTRTIMS